MATITVDSNSAVDIQAAVDAAGAGEVYNCILWGGTDGALLASGTTGTMTNCAAGNNTDDIDDQSGGEVN